jgi:integrase
LPFRHDRAIFGTLGHPGQPPKNGAQSVSRVEELAKMETANAHSKRVLTEPFIKALKAAPDGKRYSVPDALVPGLLVRVSAKGTKSFVLWKRWNGAQNPSTRALGRVGALTLAKARDKARAWLDIRSRGDDPRELEMERREKEAERKALTFGTVMDDYLARVVRKRRHAKDDEREIRKELLPRWKNKPLSAITRRDVVRLIDTITDRGAQRQAHNIFGHIRAFFRWAIERGAYGIELSPCTTIRPASLIGKKATRDRVLNDDEIRALWHACDRKVGFPFGPALLLLLLTGQRKLEIGNARWSEIDLDAKTLTIPASRFKTATIHVVPLSEDAMMIVEGLPRFEGPEDFLFTLDGRRAVTGYSTAKERVDEFMRTELGELAPWTIHDLRRTVRTRLAALRVNSDVAEAVLGHVKPGVIGIYDRHRYDDEKREALQAWAIKLRSIVGLDTMGNVVTLRQA